MKTYLKSNLVTEWVYKLIPITSHQKAVMVITEVCPVYMPVMAALGFTVDTVYYGGKKMKCQ